MWVFYKILTAYCCQLFWHHSRAKLFSFFLLLSTRFRGSLFLWHDWSAQSKTTSLFPGLCWVLSGGGVAAAPEFLWDLAV